jgi:arsenite oxidase large subunit
LHDPELDLGVPEGPTYHSKWLSVFNSLSGKGLLHKTPWSLFADYYDRIKPRDGEFWVTMGRINELGRSGFDDVRKAYIHRRWADQWIEIHPDDAKRLAIESGDQVRIENDDGRVRHRDVGAIKEEYGAAIPFPVLGNAGL